MKLTNNFNLDEFACKDGTYPKGIALENVKELANNLQVLRDYLGVPIIINSGFRSVKYNDKIGGVKSSQHLIGKAGDIRTATHTPKQIAKAIEHLIETKKMKQGGIGIYPTFVHYDIRGTKARWNYA